MNLEQEITLNRDTLATIIPAGEEHTITAGTVVTISQALGGAVTVRTAEGLYRIPSKDWDALGTELNDYLNETATQTPQASSDKPFSEALVWDALKQCFDPEIPLNIVDLGLIHVPEGRKLFPNLDVKENLEMGSYRRGKPNRAVNIDMVLDVFPRLKDRLSQPGGTLSGGEHQMVAIGRGLMAEPRILILDEPSLGLSPLLVENMFNLIKKINDNGLSVVLVEQNVVQSLDIADRAYVLEQGSVQMSGKAAELRNNSELKKSYLGL